MRSQGHGIQVPCSAPGRRQRWRNFCDFDLCEEAEEATSFQSPDHLGHLWHSLLAVSIGVLASHLGMGWWDGWPQITQRRNRQCQFLSFSYCWGKTPRQKPLHGQRVYSGSWFEDASHTGGEDTPQEPEAADAIVSTPKWRTVSVCMLALISLTPVSVSVVWNFLPTTKLHLSTSTKPNNPPWACSKPWTPRWF